MFHRTHLMITLVSAMLLCLCTALGVGAASDTGSIVARGSGPFEVSGSPGSYAVAWVDGGAETRVLSLAVVDDKASLPLVRRVSETVDGGERILLAKYLDTVAVAWRERGRWHLGLAGSNGPQGWTEIALHRSAVPIAISLGPGGLVVLTSPAVEDNVDHKDVEKRRGLEWPPLVGSALLRVDLARVEIEVIHEFDELFTAGTVRFREEGWTVAGIGPAADAVRYTEIGSTGRVAFARRLSAAPEPGMAPELKETLESTVVAWVERNAGRRVALLGRIGRLEADLEFRERTLGWGEASEVRLSEGIGLWAGWRETGAEATGIQLVRLDESGGASSAMSVAAEGIERFWLLDGGDSARLFVQAEAVGGTSELRVHDFDCSTTSADRRAVRAATGATTVELAKDCTPGQETPLGGVEEPCDGRDNDGDGYIDEGCDGICDNPEKVGSDVRVTSNDALSDYPSLVWTGSEYGVAWEDARDGSYEIYFARLDAAGNKTGADVRVTNAASDSTVSSLVWTGSEYGVAWQDYRDGNWEIYFARLDAAGSKIGSDVRVTSNAGDSASPVLVWTGSTYGVSWDDTRDGNYEIYFARLDATGNKIGADVRVTNYLYYSGVPSLAWTGSEYGVAWQDGRAGNFEIYFARIDAAGGKIGSDVRVTSNAGESGSPVLIWTGNEYGVAWHDSRDGNYEIYFARIDAAGTKMGSDVRVTNNGAASGDPSPVWTGSGHAVSWDEDRDGNHEIYFARVRCCDDADADGWSECAGDTNDRDPASHPGALEICDGHDNDSDATIDEGCDANCDNPRMGAPELPVTFNDGLGSDIPSLVWTGSEYGVAWQDNRDGDWEIYFAELDAAGNRIGADVRVTYNVSSALNPSLAWTGSEYGLAWNDNRDGNAEIYFARLDAAGYKIGADVRVTNAASNSLEPSVVWTGSEYGVAWEDARDGNREIYFARIDAAGNKIGADVRVTNNASISSRASLVWTGSEYGVAWEDNRDGNYEIYFTRISAAGSKIGADVRATTAAGYSHSPSLVWAGSVYGVAWEDARDGDAEIYFARLDATGIKIGGDVRVTNAPSYASLASLVWTGSEYGVAWVDDRDGNNEVYLARISAAGSKAGSDLRVTNNVSYADYPSLVWTGSDYGVAWRDDRGVTGEIYSARVRCCDDADADGWSECAGDTNDRDPSIYPGAIETCDGRDNNSDGLIDEGCDTICDSPEKVGSDARVTNDSYGSFSPSLAWTGSAYGVAWHDTRNGNSEIYFARLDAAGGKIGTDVRVTNYLSDSGDPSIVWTGSEYGVAWVDQRDGNGEIYFARLDAAGNKVSADVRVTNDLAYSLSPSLVWTGSEYGVAWKDYRDGNAEIYFARLDATGIKIGADVRVTNNVAVSTDPCLVWAGLYGLVWVDNRDANDEIYFVRLEASGAKVGADVRVTNNPSSVRLPSLVWTGTGYGVSWEDYRDANFEIYFARLDTAGSKLGVDVRITNDAAFSTNSSLAWTGSEYAVSWQDYRNGGVADIYFARISASGTKIGSDVRLTYAASESYYPSLVWTGTAYGVAWEDYRNGGGEIYFARVSCCDNVDGDGYNECHDCNDADATVWAIPGEVRSLLFTGKTTLSWTAPASPGCPAPRYDTIRSNQRSDFVTGAVCVESDDASNTMASDGATPAGGNVFYYLVRGGDSCGEGSSGTRSSGEERIVRSCP